MIDPELFRKVRGIEVRTAQLVDSILAGAYHSAFKGRGIEFEQVRAYIPGDDVRAIDWNVTARAGEPHIKNFREERELTVLLAVDMSASTGFGSGSQTKRELAAELAAVLALAAIRNKDKIGLVLFTDTVELVLPPRKGRQHVLRLIREMLAFQPSGRGTDIAAALRFMGKVYKRRAVLFLISDLLAEGYDQDLSVLSRRHDVIVAHTADAREHSLVSAGLIAVEDSETGAMRVIDTTSRQAKGYDAAAQAASARRTRLLGSLAIDCLALRTDEPYHQGLRTFFNRRSKRGPRVAARA